MHEITLTGGFTFLAQIGVAVAVGGALFVGVGMTAPRFFPFGISVWVAGAMFALAGGYVGVWWPILTALAVFLGALLLGWIVDRIGTGSQP